MSEKPGICRVCGCEHLDDTVGKLRNRIAELEQEQSYARDVKSIMDSIRRSRPQRTPEEVRADLDGTVKRLGEMAAKARANLTDREREVLDTRFAGPPSSKGDEDE